MGVTDRDGGREGSGDFRGGGTFHDEVWVGCRMERIWIFLAFLFSTKANHSFLIQHPSFSEKLMKGSLEVTSGPRRSSGHSGSLH